MKKNMLVFAALTATALNVNAAALGNVNERKAKSSATKADTASISLQAANVVSTRAGKHTPMAYKNLSGNSRSKLW